MTEKLVILALALALGGAGAGGKGIGIFGYAVNAAVRQQLNESLDRIRPQTAEADDRFLILVNKDHPLPDNYEVELQTAPYGACNVSVEMYPALRQMLDDGQQEGLQFVVASGYRNANYQQGLLDEDIRDFMAGGMSYDEAYEEATKDTMPAGHSEHSTGLAVDIVSASYQMLNDGLESRPEIQWLQKHCAEYGFILRYPKGKEDITRIVYESWHFRYVGTEAAKEIMERGITLEEYVEEREKDADEPEESRTGWSLPGLGESWLGDVGKALCSELAERVESAAGASGKELKEAAEDTVELFETELKKYFER